MQAQKKSSAAPSRSYSGNSSQPATVRFTRGNGVFASRSKIYTCPQPDSPQPEEFTDEQFAAALKKASVPLERMAAKARADMKAGRGRKFPE